MNMNELDRAIEALKDIAQKLQRGQADPDLQQTLNGVILTFSEARLVQRVDDWTGDDMEQPSGLDHAFLASEEPQATPEEVPDRIRIHLEVGDILYGIGRWDAAVSHYMAVVNLSEKNDDLKSQAGAFRRVGRVQRRQGRWRQARQTLNRAARLFRVLEDDAGEAETHLNLGNIEFEQGNYEKAERAYNRALRFSRNLNLPNMTGNINLSLGAVYQARGGLAEAITHFSASLKAFEEVGDRPRFGMAHFSLGITHRDYGSWVRSGMSMEESLKIAEQTRNIGLLGMVYLRRAETQIMLSDATMAMIYGRRAMRVFVQLDDPLGQGDVYRIYGLAAGLRQAWRQAFEYLNRGLELQRQYTCPLGEAEASEALGGVYEQMNDRTNAISWYEKALGLYQDLGAGKDEQRVRETLKNARSGAA